MTEKQLLNKWTGYDFNLAPRYTNKELYSLWNSSERGEGLVGDAFFEDYVTVVKSKLHEVGMQLAGWNYNWFTAYGFVYDPATGEYGYFSISDIRYWQDEWLNNILIRTAKHTKDYTGGCNNYTTLYDLGKDLKSIMDREYRQKYVA